MCVCVCVCFDEGVFFGFSSNGVEDLMSMFNVIAILVEEQLGSYLTHRWGTKWAYTFPKSISLKDNR